MKAGTQPGTEIRLRGKGVPYLRRPGQRGDLHVIVDVEVPSRLSQAQREALEAYAAPRARSSPSRAACSTGSAARSTGEWLGGRRRGPRPERAGWSWPSRPIRRRSRRSARSSPASRRAGPASSPGSSWSRTGSARESIRTGRRRFAPTCRPSTTPRPRAPPRPSSRGARAPPGVRAPADRRPANPPRRRGRLGEAWKDHFHVLHARSPPGDQAELATPSSRRATRSSSTSIPGMAFGTGLHPTTRLCLVRSRTGPIAGRSGARSTSAAARASCRSRRSSSARRACSAIDIDPIAIEATHANARHNRVGQPGPRPRGHAAQRRGPVRPRPRQPDRSVLIELAANLATELRPRRDPDRVRASSSTARRTRRRPRGWWVPGDRPAGTSPTGSRSRPSARA